MKGYPCTPAGRSLLMMIVLGVSCLFSLEGRAGDSDENDKDEGHHGHHSNHHVSIFVGAAHEGHTEFALGGEYAYRLPFAHRAFSVTALVDATVLADHVHTLVGGGVFVHPIAGLKLLAAPSVGLSEGHSAFTMRLGAGYDVHIGNFSITPTFNLDFTDGHTTQVFGLGVGMGF